jgi:hypothetical protein
MTHVKVFKSKNLYLILQKNLIQKMYNVQVTIEYYYIRIFNMCGFPNKINLIPFITLIIFKDSTVFVLA